jgi:hypothetical protein
MAAIPVATVAVSRQEEAKVPAGPIGDRSAEGAVEVIVGFGHPRKEAREKVRRALVLLAGIGRTPTGDEIPNTALRGRPFLEEELSPRAESGARGRRPG